MIHSGDATEGKLVTRRGVPIHPENPFMEQGAIQTRAKRVFNKAGDMALVCKDGGETISNVAGFVTVHEVDSAKFVKLFVQGVRALKELTASGTKVFEVLYNKMQDATGKDLVYMGLSAIDQSVTPMSKATYMRGMSELIEKKFIAATPNQGLFWINPAFVWNGDRLEFLSTYLRRPTPKAVSDWSKDQPSLFPTEDLD